MSMRIVSLLGLSIFAVGCMGPEELIENPDVDVWCGDKPCGWLVDGRIERVGTWHSHDYAVSFESDDARLHQANPDADDSIDCFSFSMVAKVSPGTKAFVELDFLDDGKVDWSEQIPTADFEHFSFYVTPPTWFEGVRFIVRKEGPGEMVLAKLRALDDVTDRDKCTADAVVLEDLPQLAGCRADAECSSGTCIGGACAGCSSDGDCPSDQVCGYADFEVGYQDFSSINVIPACIEQGVRRTGALCLGDGECDSGICCDGVCSECCGEGSCDEDIACELSVASVDPDAYALPHQCAPGEGLGERGAFCTTDGDCASGSCSSLECSGLCSLYSGLLGSHDCAKSDCEEPSCATVRCAIETVDVGRCL
jgi:hypothetical protein